MAFKDLWLVELERAAEASRAPAMEVLGEGFQWSPKGAEGFEVQDNAQVPVVEAEGDDDIDLDAIISQFGTGEDGPEKPKAPRKKRMPGTFPGRQAKMIPAQPAGASALGPEDLQAAAADRFALPGLPADAVERFKNWHFREPKDQDELEAWWDEEGSRLLTKPGGEQYAPDFDAAEAEADAVETSRGNWRRKGTLGIPHKKNEAVGDEFDFTQIGPDRISQAMDLDARKQHGQIPRLHTRGYDFTQDNDRLVQMLGNEDDVIDSGPPIEGVDPARIGKMKAAVAGMRNVVDTRLKRSSEKEKHEHPWMTDKQAVRVAKDHERLGEESDPKTNPWHPFRDESDWLDGPEGFEEWVRQHNAEVARKEKEAAAPTMDRVFGSRE